MSRLLCWMKVHSCATFPSLQHNEPMLLIERELTSTTRPLIHSTRKNLTSYKFVADSPQATSSTIIQGISR